jgi:hypothetical protein
MNGFIIRTSKRQIIRFRYYVTEAPVTIAAFDAQLPFTRTLLHARVSGQEIWTNDAPVLDIIQENASVFAVPGEVVIGPIKPARAKTSGCLGIYYGEGKGLDSCNIFARVFDEDFHLLQELGDDVWRNGQLDIIFEKSTE